MSSALGRRRGLCEPPAERGLPAALFLSPAAVELGLRLLSGPSPRPTVFISCLYLAALAAKTKKWNAALPSGIPMRYTRRTKRCCNRDSSFRRDAQRSAGYLPP